MARWFAFQPASMALDERLEIAIAESQVAAAHPHRATPLTAADYVA
jgi:hypothetical protein